MGYVRRKYDGSLAGDVLGFLHDGLEIMFFFLLWWLNIYKRHLLYGGYLFRSRGAQGRRSVPSLCEPRFVNAHI